MTINFKHHYIRHVLKAGFTVRTFDEDWGNFEWDQDDHMEELWTKGEAGVDLDSFIQSPIILEPEHFQCLFLMMGFLNSIGLIILLWDILANRKLKFLNIMLSGLSACLLITFGNLFFFSTAFWTPTEGEWSTLIGPDLRIKDAGIIIAI